MEIGSYIECIAEHKWNPEHIRAANQGTRFPVRGQIYTVRGFNNYEGVFLNEIINPKVDNGHHEVAIHKNYFKEIEISENHLEQINELLNIKA